MEHANPKSVLPRRGILAAFLSAVLAAGLAFGLYTSGLTQLAKDQVAFSRGASFASGEQVRLRSFLLPAVEDAQINLTIIGHSGTAGDARANQELSLLRAQTVRDMAVDLGIDPARITTLGVGGDAPLQKLENESDRAYQARLARATVSLQRRP